MGGVRWSSKKAVLEEVGEPGRGAKILAAIIWIKTEVQWEVSKG